MAEKSIILGNVCLDDYVSEPVNKEDELKRINEEIRKLNDIQSHLAGKKYYGIEGSPLIEIEEKKAKLIARISRLGVESKYGELDLSFLNMGNRVNYNGKNLQLPKFSVYNLNRREFIATFYAELGSFSNTIRNRRNVGIGFNVPRLFGDKLLESTEFIQYYKRFSECVGYLFESVPKKLASKYCNLRHNNIRIGTLFGGIIPDETREKIGVAINDIGQNNIYVIAETKSENWTDKLPTRDPLAVGVLGNKCYFIDHFNATPLEDYIRKEFSS